MLGVLALATLPDVDSTRDDALASTVATNFVLYRGEACRVALAGPPASGDRIDENLLRLPSNWRGLRAWDNRMDAGRFYVFGPASADDVAEIRRLLRGSLAISVQDGSWPSFIPSGAVISVIEVHS